MKTCTNCALVICIGDRFFRKFGKNKKIQTAWCLAGAELFMSNQIDDVINILDSKNKKYIIRYVTISAMPKTTPCTACGA
jgi:hypothetical protein